MRNLAECSAFGTARILTVQASATLCPIVAIQTKSRWDDWKKSEKRPSFITDKPDKLYREQGWVSWDDWMGG